MARHYDYTYGPLTDAENGIIEHLTSAGWSSADIGHRLGYPATRITAERHRLGIVGLPQTKMRPSVAQANGYARRLRPKQISAIAFTDLWWEQNNTLFAHQFVRGRRQEMKERGQL